MLLFRRPKLIFGGVRLAALELKLLLQCIDSQKVNTKAQYTKSFSLIETKVLDLVYFFFYIHYYIHCFV